MKSRQRPIINVYKEFVCRKSENITEVTVFLEFIIAISSNHIRRFNIDSTSLDKLDTEKFVFDWIESVIASRHLYGHN